MTPSNSRARSAAGADVEVGDQQLSAGLLGAGADHRPLAGHRVLVYLTCTTHVFSFLMSDPADG
jgi:hypothetical protein